jgi:hypothetical protein
MPSIVPAATSSPQMPHQWPAGQRRVAVGWRPIAAASWLRLAGGPPVPAS